MDSFGVNLWDDSSDMLDVAPTGGTKAEYPSVLPSEDELRRFANIPSEYGKVELEADNQYIASIDGPETIYIISERPNFRSESVYSALNQRFFHVKMLYMMNPNTDALDTPIGFFIDITPQLIKTYAKPMIRCLQKYSADKVIPVFLLGEPDDLTSVYKSCPFPSNVIITEFARPVDLKECVFRVTEVLNSDYKEERKKHILVVDDSIVFLRLVQRALEKEYRVTATSSAFNCIGTLAKLEELPDLIIIDYQMPACDGLTLCKMIKEEKRTKDIPIIFYTGNSDVDAIIELMPMIDGYMPKSQPVIDLRSYLDDLFKKEPPKDDRRIWI